MKYVAIAASLALSSLGATSALAADAFDASITIRADQPGATIDPNIYGHFVEHLGAGVYGGIWVGEDSDIPNVRGIRTDVVEALKKIDVPLIRWPGGCYGEIYHWRDAIGPQEDRPMGLNSAWGNEAETNAFGTDEFMDFLEQIDAEAFISVNVTTGTPGEARDWLQYMTSPAESGPGSERTANGHPEPYDVAYIGIGNETWGCGGNMTADYYADVYRLYEAALANYGTLVAGDANSDDYAWTRTLLEKALKRHADPLELAWMRGDPMIDMMGLHFYTFAGNDNDWGQKSPAVGFNEEEWARSMVRTAKMDEMIVKHDAIMDEFDPEGRIPLSVNEWGAWWARDPNAPSNLFQQNTLRDAVIAGLTLNIFHDHADRVKMANIAQMVNVLQAMILTRDEDMILTPTYHVFDLYQVHQGATMLPAELDSPVYEYGASSLPALSVSSSRGEDGMITLSVVNMDPNRDARIALQLEAATASGATGRVITAEAMDAHNDFDIEDPLVPVALTGIDVDGASATFTVPAKSVSVIRFE